MPRMVIGARAGNAQTYTLGGVQTFHIETVSLTVDCTGAGASSLVTVSFLAPNGAVIATSESSGFLDPGTVYTATLAPNLPDTFAIGLEDVTNIYTSGLVDTTLPPLCTVTASASDPGAVVTSMRLWVDDVVDDEIAADDEATRLGNWALVPGPGA